MAGARVTIDINDAEIIGHLHNLIEATGNAKPALDHFSEYMTKVTREQRFEQSQDPWGHAWEAIKYDKPYNADKPLVLDGNLMGELHPQNNERELQFGSNLGYAATHQFGRPDNNIPARPFLGLNDQDKQELIQTLKDFLISAL